MVELCSVKGAICLIVAVLEFYFDFDLDLIIIGMSYCIGVPSFICLVAILNFTNGHQCMAVSNRDTKSDAVIFIGNHDMA